MIYIIIALLLAMLYLDNKSSELLGGFESRGPFQAVFIVFVSYMLICAIYSCLKNHKAYFSGVLKSVFLITIVLLMNTLLSDKNDHYSVLSCLYSFAWLILIFAMDNIFMYMDDNKIASFSLLMGCVFLYTVYNAIQTFFYMSSTYDRLLIPSIYISVMFIPWILSVSKKFCKIEIKSVLLLIMMLITIISVKRGAILALFVAIMVYYYKYSKIRKRNSSLFRVLLCVFFFSFIVLVVDSFLEGSIMARFSADNIKDGSGRGDSNSYAIDLLLNSGSVFELFLGYPSNIIQQGEFAGHNDWLSFALKYGLVGVFCFGSMFYKLFRNAFKSNDLDISPCYCVLVVVMFLQSIYSTAYNPTIHPIFAMMYIGFAEAQIRKNKLFIDSNE